MSMFRTMATVMVHNLSGCTGTEQTAPAQDVHHSQRSGAKYSPRQCVRTPVNRARSCRSGSERGDRKTGYIPQKSQE